MGAQVLLLPPRVTKAIQLLDRCRTAKLKLSPPTFENTVSISLQPDEFRLLSQYLWGEENGAANHNDSTTGNVYETAQPNNGNGHDSEIQSTDVVVVVDPAVDAKNLQPADPTSDLLAAAAAPDYELGAYVRDKVPYSYCQRTRQLELRIMSILHDTVAHDAINLIFGSARAAAHGRPEAMAFLDSLEVRRSIAASSYLIWDWDESGEEEDAAIKSTRRYPDAAIGVKGDVLVNTLILEVDFSRKKGPEKVNGKFKQYNRTPLSLVMLSPGINEPWDIGAFPLSLQPSSVLRFHSSGGN